jgi:hypothetical protein
MDCDYCDDTRYECNCKKGTKIEEFFKMADPDLIGSLGEALYAYDEIVKWPDYVDCVSIEQAILCWKIIEKLKVEVFPEELRV